MTQDEDTLDTWFSFSTVAVLYAGMAGARQKIWIYFYPTDVLVTGYDIIFFWGNPYGTSPDMHILGKAPFNTVLIHGLVRDSQGRKMSQISGQWYRSAG